MYQYTERTEENPVVHCEFVYDIEELLEKIREESAYLAITIKTKEGVPLVDDYAVTEDEDDIITTFLTQTIRELGNREFAKLARVPYTLEEQNLTFRCKARHEARGREQNVDDDIVNYLKASSFLKWVELKGLANFIPIYQQRKMEALASLHKSLFEFRGR